MIDAYTFSCLTELAAELGCGIGDLPDKVRKLMTEVCEQRDLIAELRGIKVLEPDIVVDAPPVQAHPESHPITDVTSEQGQRAYRDHLAATSDD